MSNAMNPTPDKATLQEDKINAEIKKLIAETSKLSKEMALQDDKMRAEIAKLIAESSKLNKEAFWHPIMIAAGFIAAIATIVKLFF